MFDFLGTIIGALRLGDSWLGGRSSDRRQAESDGTLRFMVKPDWIERGRGQLIIRMRNDGPLLVNFTIVEYDNDHRWIPKTSSGHNWKWHGKETFTFDESERPGLRKSIRFKLAYHRVTDEKQRIQCFKINKTYDAILPISEDGDPSVIVDGATAAAQSGKLKVKRGD